MNRNFIKACAVIGLLAYAGCASEAEKRERVENAFDLSGSYKTMTDSEVKLQFAIANENGRNDIIMNLKRETPLTAEESQFLTENQMDVNFVKSHMEQSLELGRGKGKYENYSDDFGETSQTSVCTEYWAQNANRQLQFCFYAVTTKKTKKMSGHFSIGIEKRDIEIVDGKEQEVISYASHSMEFNVNMEAVLYKQYAGTYSGEIYSLVSGFNVKPLAKVVITLDQAAQTYSVGLVGNSPVTFNGDTYTYDKNLNTASINELKDPDYPAVQLVMKGPQSKRIVMFGQIWSLGNYTGSVTFVDTGVQTDIGTFRFARK